MDLRVSVADILRAPGSVRAVRLEERLCVDVPLAHLRGPVRVDLALESVVEGIVAVGTIAVDVGLECRRCLRDFSTTVEEHVSELYTADAELAEGGYPLDGTEVDLEPLCRDAIILALPDAPLCRPDCPGICPRCGAELAEGACGCSAEDIDPRWGALSALWPEKER